jgi:hypothetical protein
MRGLLICFFVFFTIQVYAQNSSKIDITISSTSLKIDDDFSIKVIIKNSPNSNVKAFPDLVGFRKEGRSVSHSNVKMDGKTILQHVVTQNYTAAKWGFFDIPAFNFEINGKIYKMESDEVTIVNSGESMEGQFSDTLANEDALLFLFVDKSEIVVGESFRIHLAFYVSEENTASWEFPKNLNYQIELMNSKLKPVNCLESKRDIRQILPEPAVINGKKYIRYKFLEGVYYPLNDKRIQFPSVQFDIDKVTKAGEKPTIEVKPFYSKPFVIQVNPLPEHPLKNRVSVGDFRLTELTKIGSAKTGKIMNYSLNIKGIGNIKTMLFDKPENDSDFDFYPAHSNEVQVNGFEQGDKTFMFKVFPKDSGYYEVGDYFYWIYFNTVKRDYDTLRAKQSLLVTGPTITTSSVKGIYDDIENKSIAGKEIDVRKIIKMTVNVLLFLMLVGMLFIFDFKKEQKQ